jgi:hypothetical protein
MQVHFSYKHGLNPRTQQNPPFKHGLTVDSWGETQGGK